MPTWGQILREIGQSKQPDPGKGPDFDGVRRKYLAELNKVTGRAVIVYMTGFTIPVDYSPRVLMVGLGDVQAFMEAVSNIKERNLDLILHSPGGSAEAAESIVEYLRQRFDHIRVFIPMAAMSAATMIALSADEIVMGQHSQLGPIDPQLVLPLPEGARSSPARAILRQFERARDECANDPRLLAGWTPILRGYAPGLLIQCADARKMAETMVTSWLQRYMLRGMADGAAQASRIAAWFADYDAFQSHGRRVGADQARQQGLNIVDLEKDNRLQDAVLSVFHASTITMEQTGTAKIVENHLGRTVVVKSEGVIIRAGPPTPTATPAAAPVPPLSRADRRRQQRGRK